MFAVPGSKCARREHASVQHGLTRRNREPLELSHLVVGERSPKANRSVTSSTSARSCSPAVVSSTIS
jgi:hypothetical protein